jgi:hypothetical protein
MDGDPSGGGMGEIDDGDEDGNGMDGNPSGPGVGEDLPISDGLSILLFLVCLYILWKPVVRYFRWLSRNHNSPG